MYINDVHILGYVAVAILGGIIGNFLNWANKRLEEDKSVFSKDFFKERKNGQKTNYILIIIMALIYVGLLFTYGFEFSMEKNITLIKYMVLAPMLVSAFIIDYKLQIIPNRLNLTMFELGLVFAFLSGIVINYNVALNMLLGGIIGGGIFLFITLLGGLIAGKEAMGFGDVKLMGAMGLYLGVANIIAVSVIAFLLGAIISIILLVSKIRKTDEYIPFGPFIVIAAFVVIFVPFNILLKVLFTIFTLGLYNRRIGT